MGTELSGFVVSPATTTTDDDDHNHDEYDDHDHDGNHSDHGHPTTATGRGGEWHLGPQRGDVRLGGCTRGGLVGELGLEPGAARDGPGGGLLVRLAVRTATSSSVLPGPDKNGVSDVCVSVCMRE